MSALRNVLNNYVFAPDRYLDKDGYPARGNTFRRIFSAPENKAGALTAGLLACFFATASDEKMFSVALTSGIVFGLAKTVKFIHRDNMPAKCAYYFDTTDRSVLTPSPRTAPPVEVLSSLLHRKSELAQKVAGDLLVTGSIGGGIYLMTDNAPFTGMLTATFASARVAGTLSKAWYTNQYLDGVWDILTDLPTENTKKTGPSAPAL